MQQTLAAVLYSALFAGALAAQSTVTLPCVQDNTLYDDPTGSLSSGAGDAIFAGVTGMAMNARRRALLQFDVASTVPAGAVIVSAELSIRTIQSSTSATVDVFGHRVLAAWGEGTSLPTGGGGSGGPATTGDATWIHTFWPSTTWTTPGGDFAAAPSFVLPTQALGVATSPATARVIADVQLWLDSPGQNHGWLLKTAETGSGTARKIDSRETTSGIAPTLRVSYLVPSQTGTFGIGCPVGAATFGYDLVGTAAGGQTLTLAMSAGPPGQLAGNFLSFGFVPAGNPILPNCDLYLPLGAGIVTHSLVTLDALGSGSAPFPVPAGFLGLRINAQAGALDPTTPNGFVLSNAAVTVLQ